MPHYYWEEASIQLLAVNYHCNHSYYRTTKILHHLDTGRDALGRKCWKLLYLCADGGLTPWVGRLWWRTPILPLSCCHIKRVTSSFQQSLQESQQKRFFFLVNIDVKFHNPSFTLIPVNSYFDFGLIGSFTGVWHFGPLFLSLSVRLHHTTKKGTFILKEKTTRMEWIQKLKTSSDDVS